MSGYSTHEQLRNDLSEEKAESRRLAAELDALKKYPTIERPTEPGWYWFHPTAARPSYWTALRVFKDGWGCLWVDETTNHETLLLDFRRGEWRGPIPEPQP